MQFLILPQSRYSYQICPKQKYYNQPSPTLNHEIEYSLLDYLEQQTNMEFLSHSNSRNASSCTKDDHPNVEKPLGMGAIDRSNALPYKAMFNKRNDQIQRELTYFFFCNVVTPS